MTGSGNDWVVSLSHKDGVYQHWATQIKGCSVFYAACDTSRRITLPIRLVPLDQACCICPKCWAMLKGLAEKVQWAKAERDRLIAKWGKERIDG